MAAAAVTTADEELIDVTTIDVTSDGGLQRLTLKLSVAFSPASRSTAVTVANVTPTSLFSQSVTFTDHRSQRQEMINT